VELQLKTREELLSTMYHQVHPQHFIYHFLYTSKYSFPSLQISVEFADLHDTPGRMQEKGVIAVS